MVAYRSSNRLPFVFIAALFGVAPPSGLAAETGPLRFEDHPAAPADDSAPPAPSRSGSGPPVPRPSNMLLDVVPSAEAVLGGTAGPPEAPGRGEVQAVVRRVPSEDAQVELADERPIGRRGTTGLSPSFRYLWPLGAVLALIAVLALVIKRFMADRRFLAGQGAMRIVARTPISAKQTLMLVKVGRRLVLIGVSPEQMSTLAIIDDPDQVAMLLGEVASSRPDSISTEFARSFQEEAEAYPPESMEDEEALDANGQVQGLLKKIRRLTGRQTVA